MMLILSFIAICVACTLLWMELQVYAPYPWWETKQIAPATTLLDAPGLDLGIQQLRAFRA
jgi:hypothetical protein